MTRWSQFVAMGLGHVARRLSLRDVVATLQAQGRRLYHLGVKSVARSSLARVNEEQPYTLYAALFDRLLAQCRALAPHHGFRFKNKLYSIDASLIDLSLKIFPWSKYALGKGAMKLHMGLDHDGFIPAFAVVTESRVMETTIARQLTLPKGSIAVFDRGYSEFAWFKTLDDTGIYFVTRRRANTLYEVIERRQAGAGEGIVSDQIVRFTGAQAVKRGMPELRLVTFDCPLTGKRYEFLTNIRHLAAGTIAAIYKSRWQIELLFRWIKQHLRLKKFLTRAESGIRLQIIAAMIAYLLLRLAARDSRLAIPAIRFAELISACLFIRKSLARLDKPPDVHPSRPHPYFSATQFALSND